MRRVWVVRWAIVASSVGLFGCGGGTRVRHEAEDALRRTAAPELDCPEQNLKLTAMSTDEHAPTRYAVEGCGASAVFSDSGRYDWERDD